MVQINNYSEKYTLIFIETSNRRLQYWYPYAWKIMFLEQNSFDIFASNLKTWSFKISR